MDSVWFLLLKAVGNFFLNPLVYWLIIYFFVLSKRRTKIEEKQFGRIFLPTGSELYHTLGLSIVFSLLVSLITFILGIVLIPEMIFVLSILIFILSFAFNYRALSASFTIGFTYIIFKWIEWNDGFLAQENMLTDFMFSGFALLIGVFLLAEALLYGKVTKTTTFPRRYPSRRGTMYGEHYLQKLSFIPFFVLIPEGTNYSDLTFFPLFNSSNIDFTFALIPFAIGFQHIIYGHLPTVIANKFRKNLLFLSGFVLMFAAISFYLPGLSLIAVVGAIIGKLYIMYRISKYDREKPLYFLQLENELKILAVIPNSPADRLGLRPGDIIRKVNDKKVDNVKELDQILQTIDTYPIFEVIQPSNEVKLIKNHSFIGDRTSLGILFTLKRT